MRSSARLRVWVNLALTMPSDWTHVAGEAERMRAGGEFGGARIRSGWIIDGNPMVFISHPQNGPDGREWEGKERARELGPPSRYATRLGNLFQVGGVGWPLGL